LATTLKRWQTAGENSDTLGELHATGGTWGGSEKIENIFAQIARRKNLRDEERAQAEREASCGLFAGDDKAADKIVPNRSSKKKGLQNWPEPLATERWLAGGRISSAVGHQGIRVFSAGQRKGEHS